MGRLDVADAVPIQMQTEAFTWLSTAVAGGGAIGAALAGLAVDQIGIHAPLTLATLAPLAAVLVGLAGRPANPRRQAPHQTPKKRVDLSRS